MAISTIIIVLISLIVTFIAIRCALIAPSLDLSTRIISVLCFLPVSFFSLYGFAASFEKGENYIYWRMSYIVIFSICLFTISRLLFIKKDKTKIDEK